MRLKNKLKSYTKWFIKILPFFALLFLTVINAGRGIAFINIINEINSLFSNGFIFTTLSDFMSIFVNNLGIFDIFVLNIINYYILVDIIFLVYDLLTYFIFVGEKFIDKGEV